MFGTPPPGQSGLGTDPFVPPKVEQNPSISPSQKKTASWQDGPGGAGKLHCALIETTYNRNVASVKVSFLFMKSKF